MAAWDPPSGWRPGAERLEREAEDSEELLRSWAERENAIFLGLRNGPEDPADERALFDSGPGLLPDERASAKHILCALLAQQGFCEELPAVLTLLDALALAAEHCWPLEGPFLTPAVLAAIFRIVVKCTLRRQLVSGSLSDKALFHTLTSLHLAIDEPSAVAWAEIGVLVALDGRVSTPSPVDWAQATLRRLEAFVAGTAGTPCSSGMQAKLRHAQTAVESWAASMTDRLAASPQLRPRAMALGACALGLVGAGLMAAEEFRLGGLVEEEDWAESLLVQAERAASSRVALAAAAGPGAGAACSIPDSPARACSPWPPGVADGVGALTAEQLAEAACCSVEELCENVGIAMAALRASLIEGPSPWQGA